MQALKRWWTTFEDKHTTAAQFIVFFSLSNGITVLQLVLMPAFNAVCAHTSLLDTAFQFLPVGVSNGHTVFLFDYSAGSMSVGGGGETVADVVTMIINATISFWVFFPIFKVIFKQEATPEDAQASAAQ